VSADLLTQLAEYGRYHEAEQPPIDIDEARARGAVVRPLMTERPIETEGRTWSGAWIAAAAAVLILLAVGGLVWLVRSGDDPPDVVDQPVVATEATTLPPESSAGDALATAHAYYEAYATDDVPAMMALFAVGTGPTSTVCYNGSGLVGVCDGGPEPWMLDQLERTETWKRASGTEYRNVSCAVTDAPEVIECTHDEFPAAMVNTAPPVPAVQTFRIGPEGIIALDSVYGPPDFLLVHDPFTIWVSRNRPDDRAVISCCEWTSVADARADGVRTGELFVEWAAYLDEIGCAFNDTNCAATAALVGFVAGYNAGDIDAVMTYFVPESAVANHPTGGDAGGLDAIRTALAEHRALAAASDPYTYSNVLNLGFTLSWDHMWEDASGEQWCGTGNTATIAGGKILSLTYATDEAPCA
jgi:hypothetical protein